MKVGSWDFEDHHLLYQWLYMNIWGAILVLHLTPTHGPLFVPIKRWHNL